MGLVKFRGISRGDDSLNREFPLIDWLDFDCSGDKRRDLGGNAVLSLARRQGLCSIMQPQKRRRRSIMLPRIRTPSQLVYANNISLGGRGNVSFLLKFTFLVFYSPSSAGESSGDCSQRWRKSYDGPSSTSC